ncbi:LysR substrate-binding domain-containing protein [Rickettsiales bacterium]|nr:LysR substrate-binding domain-containing protein [Rickettsiales bacterium]
MNIRDFEYLIAIHEFKSFLLASKKCFVSQPALSQQVKKIENELGFNIFERDKKTVITTDLGQEVIKYAENILNSYQKLKLINDKDIKIKIGLIPTICPYLLPNIVDKLNSELPNVKFYFLELKTDQLIRNLKKGDIDIGIIAYFPDLIDHKLSYHKLYDEEFLLTLPKDSDLTEDDFPKIMKEGKLILLEEGNCISENIRDICSIYKQTSFNDFYATNIETVKNMVRIGNAVALLPKLSILEEQKLKLISFKTRKTREVGLISRKSFDNQGLISDIVKIINLNIMQRSL